MNKKTKNAFITLVIIIGLILLLSTGVYINKQVLSFILGGIGTLVLEIGLYFLKGWDKEEDTIIDLRSRINKGRAKLYNMLATGNKNKIIDELVELDKILKGDDKE